MKVKMICLFLAGVTSVTALYGQVPNTLSFQGQLAVNGNGFSGPGHFKFALVDAAGTNSFWTNDGTPAGEPVDSVTLEVDHGFYSVLLGDETLPNMTAIPHSVFTNPDVHLRIWFQHGQSGFEQFSPDQPISAVGYAMMAANVPDGAITGVKIASGAIESSHLGDNIITSANVADVLTLERLNLGGTSWDGSLHLFSKPNGNGGGFAAPTGAARGRLFADDSGSELSLFLSGGQTGVVVTTRTDAGGQLTLRQADGDAGAVLYGSAPNNGAGALSLRNTDGGVRLRAYGGPNSGSLLVYDTSGTETVELLGAATGGTGSELRMRNGSGRMTVELDADWTPANGGTMRLFQADGSETIRLQADYNGSGRIIADVIQINGADLSENFDITAPDVELEPGMIVSIDPTKPGKLVLSTKAYDRTAAGVISGAGGVRPGLLMSQKGTLADGEYPVALTGRVYCHVDADAAPIAPGDLITTSDIPGHGMKVLDPAKAQGAIIGKAMTGLASGRGQVLVLVSLQ